MSDPGPRLPDSRMIAAWQAPFEPDAPADPATVPWSGSGVLDEVVVRPFLVTGGRTHPQGKGLRVETLVFAEPGALDAPLRFEARRIVEICQRPMSVADVAVGLRVPLGVTRVLVADLASSGLVRCGDQGELPIHLLERIRDRVRAL